MKTLTTEQKQIQDEFVSTYGFDPEQVAFEGNKVEPIFDFEALCLLRERLTDFTEVRITRGDFADPVASAVCEITTSQNRKIVVCDFAQVGEVLHDGNAISGPLDALRVARARAMRTGIRAAGVNLLKAHRYLIDTGTAPTYSPVDPRTPRVREIHVLANECGLITADGRDQYEDMIAGMFDGRTSSRDLDDLELHRLVVSLRAIRRVQLAQIAAAPKAA